MKLFSALLFSMSLFVTACSTTNVSVDDSLQRYFDSAGVRGDFGLFDNGQGHFTIYNLKRFRDSAYSPGATFDILQSLIAVQTGIVKDDKAVLPAADSATRDSVTGTATEVKAPLTLARAFQTGTITNDVVFQDLAKRIGKDTLKKWIDSLHYGNKDMGGFPDGAFWKDDRLKITSDEQLGLVKKLYFDQLPFFQRTQKIVRGMFQVEANSNYRLAYKTSQLALAGNHALGWVVGWVEENKHPYFFVLSVESTDARMDVSAVGLQLVKKILGPMGFFAGNK
ncbi:MAG TPA: penicillin-binding transpeptidase domain-containing protein [Puia sp.]|nr:penicillin-binding transpeptidase domain-containing protein [Puia sp.]